MPRLPFRLEPPRKNEKMSLVPRINLLDFGADEKQAADRRPLTDRYPPKSKPMGSRDLMNSQGPVRAAVAGFAALPQFDNLKVHSPTNV